MHDALGRRGNKQSVWYTTTRVGIRVGKKSNATKETRGEEKKCKQTGARKTGIPTKVRIKYAKLYITRVSPRLSADIHRERGGPKLVVLWLLTGAQTRRTSQTDSAVTGSDDSDKLGAFYWPVTALPPTHVISLLVIAARRSSTLPRPDRMTEKWVMWRWVTRGRVRVGGADNSCRNEITARYRFGRYDTNRNSKSRRRIKRREEFHFF